MKIKDLLKFNPEAELELLGTDYLPIELTIYGWSSDDCDDSVDTRCNTKTVHLIPSGLEHKYSTEAES
jgi:hypothetical protein